MICPSPAGLAAAAAGEDEAALAHTRGCLPCRRLLDEQAAVRALLATLPSPLPLARHDRIAAALLAPGAADELRPPVGRGIVAAALVAAAAAAGWIVVRAAHEPLLESRSAPPAATAPPASPLAAVDRPSPPSSALAAAAGDRDASAPASLEPAASAPVPELSSLEPAASATVPARTSPESVAAAPIPARSAARLIDATSVFGSSGARDGRRLDHATGTVWQREASLDPTAADAVASFRTGWRALRAGRLADAVAAFDQCDDPVVAEEAAYWAAIATLRRGDVDIAHRRLAAFVRRFPDSPRAALARAALAQLP